MAYRTGQAFEGRPKVIQVVLTDGQVKLVEGVLFQEISENGCIFTIHHVNGRYTIHTSHIQSVEILYYSPEPVEAKEIPEFFSGF